MSYYRYALAFPQENSAERSIRSMTPLDRELKNYPYYTYRYYTSEKDDAPNCHVISLGHECSWPGKTISRLVNRFIVHYVVRGAGTFCGTPVQKGQLFFTHPYEEYNITTDDKDPMEFYYIGIAGPGTENIMRNAGFFSVPKIHECRFIEKISSLFYEPLCKPHTDSDTDFYLMSFFLRLMSLHKNSNIQSTDTPKDEAFFYYKQALIFIQEYLLDGITPKDVAEYLHISPSYLRVIFSKYCKYSLRELLIRKRLECAANHLTFHQCTVTQAAALIGYDDYTLFSKIFKKYMGVSPQTYKNSHHNISIIQKNITVTPVNGESKEKSPSETAESTAEYSD
ncbi:MAG: helix-turn-helix domain-containing protein [Clostridia bacterium]|nr:helix-turn-helix domain-containing protein [Clostridia bacterium]